MRYILLFLLVLGFGTTYGQQTLPPVGSPFSLWTNKGFSVFDSGISVPRGTGLFYGRQSDFVWQNDSLRYWDGTKYVPFGTGGGGGMDSSIFVTHPQNDSAKSNIYDLLAGMLKSVRPGTGITVDTTDPANPIINATSGPGSNLFTADLTLNGNRFHDLDNYLWAFDGSNGSILFGALLSIKNFIVNTNTRVALYAIDPSTSIEQKFDLKTDGSPLTFRTTDGTYESSLSLANEGGVNITADEELYINTPLNKAIIGYLGNGVDTQAVAVDEDGHLIAKPWPTGGGGGGGVDPGTANRIAYYATSGSVVAPWSAITANRALKSNANGMPVHSNATATELDYLSGVTSAIQTQINAKQNTITGAATTVVYSDLATNRVVISNGSGKIAASGITTTELDYLSGLSSNAQTQFNARVKFTDTASMLANYRTAYSSSNYSSGVLRLTRLNGTYDDWTIGTGGGGSGTVNSGTANRLAYYPSTGNAVSAWSAITANRALVSDANGLPVHSGVTATELGYSSGVTSAIQTQIDAKQFTVVGAASTITSSNLSANRVVVSNGSGKAAASSITTTELDFLSGLSSNAQTQLNALVKYSDTASMLANYRKAYATSNYSSGVLRLTRLDGTFDDWTIGTGGGGSGTVNSGTANRLAYYAANGTAVSAWSAITGNRALISDANGLPVHSGVTSTELGYSSGVTSGIQAQIDAKQFTVVGAASTIASSNLSANRAMVTNGSGKAAASSVTTTEIDYLSGVTSAIQTQINAKQNTITGAATTVTGSDLTASRVTVSNPSGKIAASGITTTELDYLSGLSSNAQTQFNARVKFTDTATMLTNYKKAYATSNYSAGVLRLTRLDGTFDDWTVGGGSGGGETWDQTMALGNTTTYDAIFSGSAFLRRNNTTASLLLSGGNTNAYTSGGVIELSGNSHSTTGQRGRVQIAAGQNTTGDVLIATSDASSGISNRIEAKYGGAVNVNVPSGQYFNVRANNSTYASKISTELLTADRIQKTQNMPGQIEILPDGTPTITGITGTSGLSLALLTGSNNKFGTIHINGTTGAGVSDITVRVTYSTAYPNYAVAIVGGYENDPLYNVPTKVVTGINKVYFEVKLRGVGPSITGTWYINYIANGN